MVDTSELDIGNINPFRYRGYYYDTETGWYYLNSRYYNPLLLTNVNQSEEYESNLSYFNSLISYAYNINDYNTNELDYNSSISNQGIRDVVKFKETLLEGQILSYKKPIIKGESAYPNYGNKTGSFSLGKDILDEGNLKGFASVSTKFSKAVTKWPTGGGGGKASTNNNLGGTQANGFTSGGAYGGTLERENDDFLDFLIDDPIW